MNQNSKNICYSALPVLTALVFGSLGTTTIFAEDANISFISDNV